MHDINHALTVIRDVLRLDALELNADGQVEIVFAEGLSAYLSKIGPTELELSFRVSGLDAPSPEIMRAMLQANCLGSGVGGGRLAIDPAADEVLYCERWNVAAMDAGQVETRISEFAQYGAFWMTDGTDAILEEAARLARPAAGAMNYAPTPRTEDDTDEVIMPEQAFFVRA